MADFSDLEDVIRSMPDRQCLLIGGLLVRKANDIVEHGGDVQFADLLGRLGLVLVDEADRRRDVLADLDPDQLEVGEVADFEIDLDDENLFPPCPE